MQTQILQIFGVLQTKKTNYDVCRLQSSQTRAILTQEHKNSLKIASLASKASSSTEQCYSQTKREALTLMWGCEHYYLYLFEAPVQVMTDHKPLLEIFRKPQSKTSTRLERWALQLIPYNLKLKYNLGVETLQTLDLDLSLSGFHQNVSHSPSDSCRTTKVMEEYISFIMSQATPQAIGLEAIGYETQRDPTMQQVIQSLSSNKWPTLYPIVKAYHNV